MYYKLPLETDLTNVSYRASKEKDGFLYIEFNEGVIGEDWEEISETDIMIIAPEFFAEEPTTQEAFNAEMRAGMEEIKERQNAQDKKLLDILLNITGESDTAEDEVTSVEFMAMVEGVL